MIFETICREHGFKPVKHDADCERVARLVIARGQRGVISSQQLRDLVSDAL